LSQKQFVVLTALEQWPSLPPIQADLALYLEDQASGVSRTIDGLVRRGFVETRRHGHLRVTKAGIAQLEACRSRVVQQASRRLRRLPVDDQRALIQVVRVLSEWKASGLAI
jgi:DNA-binding MarR family transcriptional regulator